MIISWYSLDKNQIPMTINNPDDVNEIKEKGMIHLRSFQILHEIIGNRYLI